ncbi:S-methyl-5-thioribose-1-phosphate isomerase [Glutinoglossum americanum]|uniref:Methylthioribose-1-phosphate isomerase n=1 Tax=Glutinoglossum americanum TaxID=1670608 RepID=A0A9P8I5E7_9PEZI|nr:S-methyl-5-thioribose-1-phosphate isomerase [Glutinoglossum americanum]
MALQAIKYSRGELRILDQTKLPHQEQYDSLRSSNDAWHAIKNMRVRGAPAIAIVAALALAVELEIIQADGKLSEIAEEIKLFVYEKLDYLVTSRPTAVNLADAAGKLKKLVDGAAAGKEATGEKVKDAYILAAEEMLVDDVRDNENIGRHGAEWIIRNCDGGGMKTRILTHCNTGSLATAGYGTALGVIRSLHANGSLELAFCTETRPYNQGSRLTAYELVHDDIPAVLITDSMAAALLQQENIAAVVVGADRVAANGDTANKIGTYALSILARHHGAKFLVAAPRTTIDLGTASGKDIIIEMRPGEEVGRVRGPRDCGGGEVDPDCWETVSIAPKGIKIWNPSFDVTPAELIDGIVTEVGVVEKGSDGSFHLNI